MKYFLGFILMIAATAASAQTLSPIVQEIGGKKTVSGSYQLSNDTLRPLFVTIEEFSTSYDAQGQHFHPINPADHLELSETSVRLSPKETHEVSFKVKCEVLPCTFALINGMMVGHTQGDDKHPQLAIRLLLPEIVYVCPKQSGCRQSVLTAAGALSQVAQTR
jgi:hypothetical protein